MTIELDAAGDMVTGGLIAGAVERGGWFARRKSAAAHAHGPAACLDCGTPLVGPHCHRCGQLGHLHSTMGGFAHEVLHGVFHFEGKIWRTLPMLAFKPGHLTRRYVDGERTKFVTPMALFLFSVFLMFAIVAQLPAFHGFDDMTTGIGNGFSKAGQEVARSVGRHRAEITRLEAVRAQLAATKAPTAAIDKQLAKAREDLAGLEKAQRVPGLGGDSPKLAAEAEGREPTRAEARNWFEQKIEHAKQNPALFAYKMKSAGYKYSWALIPISLPFIWLLFFWKRRFGMYDHAVFATFSLSFMSLLVVALSLVGSFGNALLVGLAWTAFLIVPPIHMYKQLKYGYALGRFGAAWRTFVLLVFVTIASSLFFMLLLYLGAG